jgi:mRNA interferase YafQ
MPARLIPTSKYKKDIKRLEDRGYDLTLLDDAVDKIAAGVKLPESYRKHELKGERRGQIDIHIKPNWLLLYEPDTINGQDIIFLRRTGTHSDLLG